MAEKPRVKAPKQRTTTAGGDVGHRRTWVVTAAVVGVLLGFVAVAALFGFVGGASGKTDKAGLRTKFEAAGCTLQIVPALVGEHSIQNPSGTSPKWNTDPPTSGPHYGIPAVFGIYEVELEIARVVHNLEHGGIYILYGKDVPESTVEQLRSFYVDHKTGTIMAPLDRLGDKFALGAWVVDGDTDNGFLAKCKTFDEDSVSTFFRTLQFRGPERFDPSQLQPGM
jgi:Protein of unknown function (DUF3105)